MTDTQAVCTFAEEGVLARIRWALINDLKTSPSVSICYILLTELSSSFGVKWMYRVHLSGVR